MANDYEILRKEVAELRTYADMEGTELGEACMALCSLAQYPDYFDETLFASISQEVTRQLTWFKENTEIVEREEQFTRTVRELVDRT